MNDVHYLKWANRERPFLMIVDHDLDTLLKLTKFFRNHGFNVKPIFIAQPTVLCRNEIRELNEKNGLNIELTDDLRQLAQVASYRDNNIEAVLTEVKTKGKPAIAYGAALLESLQEFAFQGTAIAHSENPSPEMRARIKAAGVDIQDKADLAGTLEALQDELAKKNTGRSGRS